jgi:hypothetical protein
MNSQVVKKNNIYLSRQFLPSVIWAIVLLSFSFWFSYLANDYANKTANNQVTDLILSNTPVFNVNLIVVYGPILLMLFLIGLLAIRPQTIPFTLKSMALFVAVRAVFMSLTHIAQFYPQALLDSGPFINLLGAGNQGGLFFSGHTGLPFLLAIIFWDNKKIRLIFLGASILFGVSLLLGHLHYSIDILGAFFITYSISTMSKRLFAKDFVIFHKGLSGTI